MVDVGDIVALYGLLLLLSRLRHACALTGRITDVGLHLEVSIPQISSHLSLIVKAETLS